MLWLCPGLELTPTEIYDVTWKPRIVNFTGLLQLVNNLLFVDLFQLVETTL